LTRKHERGRTSKRAALGALAAGVGLALSACAPKTVTDTGQKVHTLYNIVLVMALVVFVGVEIAIVYGVIRYRRRRGDDTLPEQFHGNTKIEIVWTLIPSIIVLALFVMSMVVLADVNHEYPNDPLTVRVTGFQWQWKFDYYRGSEPQLQPLGVSVVAQGQTSPPTLVLPTDERIHFELVSNDVIHSFYVPDFLFKRDLIPGRTNTFDTTILGKYAGQMFHGQCAELCGDFHNQMTFEVEALTPQDFNAWIDKTAKEQAKNNTCAPTGNQLEISAANLAFDKKCLAAPANQASTLTFDNKDTAGVPHNVEIYTKNPTEGGTRVAGATGLSDTVTAPGTTTYKLQPIKPGTYYFQCDVHTGMNGAFVVK
jgi:cytochrome c oxidase subunit II